MMTSEKYARRAWQSLFAIPVVPLACAYIRHDAPDWLINHGLVWQNGQPIDVVALSGLLAVIALWISVVINGLCSLPNHH